MTIGTEKGERASNFVEAQTAPPNRAGPLLVPGWSVRIGKEGSAPEECRTTLRKNTRAIPRRAVLLSPPRAPFRTSRSRSTAALSVVR